MELILSDNHALTAVVSPIVVVDDLEALDLWTEVGFRVLDQHPAIVRRGSLHGEDDGRDVGYNRHGRGFGAGGVHDGCGGIGGGVGGGVGGGGDGSCSGSLLFSVGAEI